MYLLKQWALKSSAPRRLLSSSPPASLTPSLCSLDFQLDLLLHKAAYISGASKELSLCSTVASLKGLSIQRRAPQSSQSATGDLCPIMSAPLLASALPSSSFLSRSTPSIPPAGALSSVCDPSVAPPCLAALGAGAGAVHGPDPGRSPPPSPHLFSHG